MYFKELLNKSFQEYGIEYETSEEKSDTHFFRRMAFLSFKSSYRFYKDFIDSDKIELLYGSLSNSLNRLWNHELTKTPENKSIWQTVKLLKFEIFYVASDKIALHFGFSFNWDDADERFAWIEMCNLIKSYEIKDDFVVTTIQSIHAEKDQTRYFSFNISSKKWDILNPISDATFKLSTDYLIAREDKRIRKPDIILNEDDYLKYFIWDQQWVLKLQNLSLVMAQPNDIALYLSLSEKNALIAKAIFDNEYNSRDKKYYRMLLEMKETSVFYDYFEHVISSIIFSYTAIETLSNICIVDDYEHVQEKDGIKTIYSKSAIERKFKLRDKLKLVLTDILKTPNPSDQSWWQDFIDLEEIRNEIIHTKQGKSEDRYSLFMSSKIFELISVGKKIVEYYGIYINKNLELLLIDYPYGYGYDNALPMFMTNEDYWKELRKLHNVYENKEQK